jgi:hypothetical protein
MPLTSEHGIESNGCEFAYWGISKKKKNGGKMQGESQYELDDNIFSIGIGIDVKNTNWNSHGKHELELIRKTGIGIGIDSKTGIGIGTREKIFSDPALKLLSCI